MEFFNLIAVEEAKDRLMDTFHGFHLEKEEVHILESTNRVLAEDIVSDIDVPEFNRSTVDGYAIRSQDSYGASESVPSLLKIIGKVEIGKVPAKKIGAGEAMYVPTGGMIPEGADGVVMIEYTEKLDEEELMVYKSISAHENVTYKGDDIKEGEVALRRGRILTPEAVGVLAALGISKVKVYEKPKFYIISTGDELVAIDEKLELGKIRDINTYTLYSLITRLGGQVVGKAIVKDDYDLLRDEVEKALDMTHIVLISGGSSVGNRDYTAKVINSFDGKGVFVHGIAIKPGKPTIIGEGKGKVIFGLPGHPVSSIVVFKTLVEAFVRRKMGAKEYLPSTRALLDFNCPSAPGRKTYQLVNLREVDGIVYATPSFGKSGMITLLSNADGYIVLEPHEEGAYKGEEREVYLL